LLARDKSGHWSPPAFYNLGSVSFGLQAGGEKSEVILLVMTEKGIDSMLTSKVQLGADLKVAVSGAGGGGQVATADVISFARSKGAFAGVSLDGAIVSPKEKLNHGYYGEDVSAADVLVRRSVETPPEASALLVEAVAQAAMGE
jgi:lipid-binding SYLF domain-containing protein